GDGERLQAVRRELRGRGASAADSGRGAGVVGAGAELGWSGPPARSAPARSPAPLSAMMPAAQHEVAPLSIVRVLCFGVGAGVWLTSFVLPAVSDAPSADPYPGFVCAIAALSPLMLTKTVGILAIAGGLLNPMILSYAAAWFARSRSVARPLIA